FDQRAIDGRAGVTLGLALERDAVVEPGGDFGRIECDLEFRAFVFLDVERSLAVLSAADADAIPSPQSVARRGKARVERTVVVALMLGLGDLLAVGIGENNRDRAAGEHLVVVFLLIDAQGDAFVVDGLARAIESAVGEEDGVAVGLRLGYLVSIRLLV